jgi:hypothetical protein
MDFFGVGPAVPALAPEDSCRRGIEYRPDDFLEIDVRLYLDGSALTWNDADNRLKDVPDALQGPWEDRRRSVHYQR